MPEAEHPGKADVDERRNLQQYLTFIQKALASVPGVPPVYGAKILQTARDMQALTGWDPAAMFLRAGMGDDRHLIRAVMAMHTRGMVVGLQLDAQTVADLSKYCDADGALPMVHDGETKWVRRGELGPDNKTAYNDLERKYVNTHIESVLDAIKDFIG